MRDRLIEILEDDYDFSDFTGQVDYEALADHLLKNGVIVPPCNVGEAVWCLKEDYDYDWDAVGYKFMGMCGDYIIVTSEYMGMAFKEQLEEMCEETMESENPSIYIFHKSRVFLTKEEAEAKLAELKGTEE
jgi:uncharacterized protein with HEPN domain